MRKGTKGRRKQTAISSKSMSFEDFLKTRVNQSMDAHNLRMYGLYLAKMAHQITHKAKYAIT